MRHKAETASLAERLNNALAQLHAQNIDFETERNDLKAQLDRAKEEIQKLRGKNRELRRGREQQGQRGEGEGEQILMKIMNYLSRVQESARQMSQVASECRVFDAQIQRAAALIQRNIIKSASGLQKYSQQLVRQWCQRETLRLENERLQAENKQLFELTTKLQQNFKETDRYLKQLGRNQGREDRHSHQRGRMNRLQQEREIERRDTVGELQQKIMRLGQKVRSLQQENTTIKNIHQRTMKKLERLESKNREEEQGGERFLGGEALQQQRRRWLQKNEEMHEQVRRLTKQLLLAEESEGKAREELASCVQIYGQWQIERQQRKAQIQKLKVAIQTYLQRIEQLQRAVGEARGQSEAMIQRLQVSEGEKEKIVSVYQLQVQQLNDLLFKKQDALAQMDAIVSREHLKMEQLKKQHTELTKFAQNLQDNTKKAVAEAEDLRKQLIQQEKVQQKLKDTIADGEEAMRQLKIGFEKERGEMQSAIQQQRREKQEMVQIMSEYKDQYYSAKRQMTKLQEDYQAVIDEQFSVKQELRNILTIADDSIDIWTLLANVRDRTNVIVKENKSLKEAQRELLLETQTKQRQANAQIEQLGQQCESLRQSMEEQRRNQLFSLKMLKMKAIERQICSQNVLSKVNSLKELIEIIMNSIKKENNDSQSFPDPQVDDLRGEIEQLKEKILLLQEKQQQTIQKQTNSSNNIVKKQEQLNLLRNQIKQMEQLNQQTEQELLSQRQTNRRLLEQIDSLKMQQEGANKEMNALAQELSKIQNQMDDYHDEKSNVESKLQHARQIYLRNEQLQAKVTQLQTCIQQLQQKVTSLQGKQLQSHSPVKSSLKAESNSDLLDMQQSSPAKDNNIEYKSNVQQQHYLSQINALLQQNKDLQSQIYQKREHIDELEHSLLLMNENHQLLTVKLAKLQQQFVQKEKELQEYRSICTRLQQEKEIFAAFRQQLQRKQQQTKEKHLQEGNEFIELTLENQASMQQIEDLEQRIEQLRKQLDQKNQKIAAFQIQLMKNEQFCQKQKQLQVLQLALLKRQQQLNNAQKQLGITQGSLLGMESMRQSKANCNIEEQISKEMKEQIKMLRCTVQQKDSIIKRNQSIIQDLLEKQKEKQAIFQKSRRDMSQLQQEITQYREHSQNLKCTLEGLTQEKQQLEEHSQQLKRERILLEEEIAHLNNLLQQKLQKNQYLTQQLQKQNIQNYNFIQKHQRQMQKKNIQIDSFKKILEQKDGKIKQLTSVIAEKQNLAQIRQKQLIEKERISSQVVSQLNNKKNQNKILVNELNHMQNQCCRMEAEMAAAQQKNMQYAVRLAQIEQIMHSLKTEQAQNDILRRKLDEALADKQKLEEIITGMQNNFAFSSNNIVIFEKRNKELTEQLSALRQQSEILRLGNDKLIKDIEKYKQNAVKLKQSLQRYEKMGSPSQIGLKLQNLATFMRSSQQMKQKCGNLQKSNAQLKSISQQLQRQLIRKEEEISAKTASTLKIQQQNRQLKQLVRKSSSIDEQNERLSSKSIQLKQDLQQLREQLLQKQAKIVQLKQSHAKELAQRQLLQSQLRDRQTQRQSLQQEAQHYRQEVKRISKEKAQVKSEAMKNKMFLEQQQSVLKSKQSQLMRESSQKEEAIRQLRQEIDFLKEQNSVLQEQSQLQSVNRMSRRSSTVANPAFQVDLPLQMPPRSRQRSVQLQFQDNTSEQQGRIFSKQPRDKLSTRLRQSEKSNLSLNQQLQALRGELKGRQASIDSLQRQFKSKVEDYSKLQRIVESLRDELNLQRKRVKNFEDLYQSIQEKRIRMVNPKVQ